MQIPPNYGQTYTQALAAVYPELAQRFDAALVGFLLADVALNRELMQADGIHPNAAGQKVVFANVWRVLGPTADAARCPVSPGSTAYSPGVPAEIDPDRYPSLVALLEASFARYAAQPAFTNLDTTMTFADVERLAPRVRGVSASAAGHAGRRARRDHGAEHAAVARRAVRHLARRHGRRERQSDVHGARARRTSSPTAARAPSSCSRISRIPSPRRCRARSREDVIVTQLGDHCSPLKRAVVNFVVKHVKKLVRPWRIPGAVGYRDALARGAALALCGRRASTGGDLAFLQYTGGTTGRAKGAMLTQRNMVANTLQAAAWARAVTSRPTPASS